VRFGKGLLSGEAEGEVELRSGSFLEAQGGGAGEMAVGQVEEREGAEGVVSGVGDFCGG
jgi:hypothetical protein